MLKTSKTGDVMVVEPPGELDSRNAQAAREALKALIEGGESRLVINLQSATFVDSSGLGALITALKAARTAGGDIRLCGINPSVRTIFELTRLIRVFTIHTNVEEAISSFK